MQASVVAVQVVRMVCACSREWLRGKSCGANTSSASSPHAFLLRLALRPLQALGRLASRRHRIANDRLSGSQALQHQFAPVTRDEIFRRLRL